APDSPAYNKFGGKALVYGGRFGVKIAAARAAGAAAVLVIHEDAAASYPWRQVANSDRIASMELVPADGAPSSSAVRGRVHWDVASKLLARAGHDIRQLKVEARKPDFHALSLEGTTFSTDFTMKAHDIVSHNVVAQLPGGKRPTQFVLYGAHWDANGKGAPDE